MKKIASRQNPLFRLLRQLANSPQARRKSSHTVLDGIHLCQAYLAQPGSPLYCVVSEKAKEVPEIRAIVDVCLSRQVDVIELDSAMYADIAQVEEGQGVLFVIDVPVLSLPDKIEDTVVFLDRIQDPGNLGSILRSAASAGITKVFCSAGSASAWSPRVLRAGMGAHFVCHIYENADLLALTDALTIDVIATTPVAQASIYEYDLRGSVAWVFGHEGQGICEVLLSKAQVHLSIPQHPLSNSLNVAASAAICFFEQLRQKHFGQN